MSKAIFFALCAVVFVTTSCKKSSSSAPVSTCPSKVYGYSGVRTSGRILCNYGLIDVSSGSQTTIAQFLGSFNDYDAAFNSSDKCYYELIDTLKKLSMGGITTNYSRAVGDNSIYTNVMYNKAVNKLYCEKSGSLAELIISGNVYTGNTVVACNMNIVPVIARSTGDIYYTTLDSLIGPYFVVHKYSPATNQTTVVDSTKAFFLLGMQFNDNDSMLYAIRETQMPYSLDFIKMNPITGEVTVVNTMSLSTIPENSSAIIDPCTNQYIFSYNCNFWPIDSNYLNQYSMNGVLLQQTATTGFYMGLQIGN